jgi:hypothetical protein
LAKFVASSAVELPEPASRVVEPTYFPEAPEIPAIHAGPQSGVIRQNRPVANDQHDFKPLRDRYVDRFGPEADTVGPPEGGIDEHCER